MKQILSFFLAVLFMGTRVGFALNVHYCGSEIASISLAHNPTNCGMEMDKEKNVSSEKVFSKKSCCKDKTLLFQNDEPQKVSSESLVYSNATLNEVYVIDFSNFIIPVLRSFKKKNWNPPPPNHNHILLMQHCFVFYG